MRILVLEPYYGGSHRAVLDGLLARLDVEADVLTLPARKWKWRMRGAAITMADQARVLFESRIAGSVGKSRTCWDLIYASTFVNLAEFYGLAGEAVAGVPSIVYFHENQFAYPNRHVADWDFQFPLTNITSALAADKCLFNTRYTRDTFIDEIGPFLKQFPDHRPSGVAERIAGRSEVIPVPFDPRPFDAVLGDDGVMSARRADRARIVWPHRWEHDKDPDTFIDAVCRLAAEDLDFEVAIAGQQFSDVPASIRRAEEMLGDRLVHVGQPESRDAYALLLASADIAVSTAINEFFGLAMVEAAYCGCYPLVPDRLAYPELYPSEFRYADADELVARLRSLILDRPSPGKGRVLAERYTFDVLADDYVKAFEQVVRQGR